MIWCSQRVIILILSWNIIRPRSTLATFEHITAFVKKGDKVLKDGNGNNGWSIEIVSKDKTIGYYSVPSQRSPAIMLVSDKEQNRQLPAQMMSAAMGGAIGAGLGAGFGGVMGFLLGGPVVSGVFGGEIGFLLGRPFGGGLGGSLGGSVGGGIGGGLIGGRGGAMGGAAGGAIGGGVGGLMAGPMGGCMGGMLGGGLGAAIGSLYFNDTVILSTPTRLMLITRDDKVPESTTSNVVESDYFDYDLDAMDFEYIQ